jgi:radical SAM protein with 4Fe4S-binding SPASM domain
MDVPTKLDCPMNLNNKIIRWDITKECNLHCKHCITANMYKELNVLGKEEIFSIINSFPANNVGRVHLLGGEPMVVPYILDVVKEIRRVGINLSLNTNGFRLDHDMEACNVLAENNVGVSFSIDGVDMDTNDIVRGKGSFERVVNAARNYSKTLLKLDRKDVICAFYFTITPDNKKDDFSSFFNFASNIGINTIIIGVLIPLGAGQKNYNYNDLTSQEVLSLTENICKIGMSYPDIQLSFPYQTPLLLQYLNSKLGTKFGLCYAKCKSGKTEYSLQADGSLFPCVFVSNLTTVANNEQREENGLLNSSIESITNNEYYTNFLEKMNDSKLVNNVEPCNKCPYNINLDICRPCPYQHGDSSDAQNEFHKNSLCSIILRSNGGNYYC